MKIYSFKFIMLISVLLVAFASCGKQKKTEIIVKEEVLPEDIVEMRDDQIKLAGIETGAVELRLLSGTLKVNGIVTAPPQNTAMVSMPMGGFVKSTSLIPGSLVAKGQTLAVIENAEFVDIQENYLEAKSKLEYTEADYNRQSELYKSDVASKKNMQQITSEYKNLKVQVKALEQKLTMIGIHPAGLTENNISRFARLVSPISGYIKTANVSIGKSVSASDILFEIVNTQKLLLQLSLFEKDADKVSKGQKIRFFINNETEEHVAQIYQTAKSVDADKTYKVYANYQGSCRNVLPGMYVNGEIETSGNKVTALPSEAIVSFEDKDFIFVFERDKKEDGKPFTEYRMIEVQEGVSDDGFTEVVLPPNFNINTAKVVIKGAYNLLSAKKNAGEMAC